MLQKSDIKRFLSEILSIIHLRKNIKGIINSLAFFPQNQEKDVISDKYHNFRICNSIINSMSFFMKKGIKTVFTDKIQFFADCEAKNKFLISKCVTY